MFAFLARRERESEREREERDEGGGVNAVV